MQVSVLLGVLVNLKGLLKGLLNRLLNGLFALCSSFVFVGIGGEYPFWKLVFRNRKLSALEIVDEEDCVKLAGLFTFFFLIALCSACLIFCASSESLAMGSCSYSCTIDHAAGDRSASLLSLFLFFSFIAIDVKLTDRSSMLPLDICCWHPCMATAISVLKSNWSLLPFPFMSCPSVYISSQEVPCFCLFEPPYLQISCQSSRTSNLTHLLVLFPPRILEHSTLFRLSLFRGVSLLFVALSASRLNCISSRPPLAVCVSVDISFFFDAFFAFLDAKFRRREIAFWNTIVASRYVSDNNFTCLSLED